MMLGDRNIALTAIESKRGHSIESLMRRFDMVTRDLPPISHPVITGVFSFLTCTGKLSQNSLEISACAVRFVPG